MSFEFDLAGIKVPKAKLTTPDVGLVQPVHVCPFRIVVSNNEVVHGMNYTFSGMIGDGDKLLVVPTVSRHLKTGDYTLEGFEDRCCVERKQLSDLFSSCGGDRVRFLAEVERMAQMEFAVVAIEADWREIINPTAHRLGWESEMNSRSVEGTIAAWSIRYPRVHWWACGDRRGAELRTFAILMAFWKEQQR